MGSIKSEFQFESYKIDSFKFSSAQLVSLLEFQGEIKSHDWKIDYIFRNPLYIESIKKYIGGLDIRLRLFPLKEGECASSDEEAQEPLVELEAGIAGVFSATKGEFTDEQIDILVKIQIPSILMPYLRSSISNFMCSGGWPHSPLPLVNITEMARTMNLQITKVK